MQEKDSMQEKDFSIENQNDDLTNKSSTDNEYSKWVDNQGDEVKNIFGFNSSAELVNGRAAMIGFIMLLLTELVFKGRPVTSSIFFATVSRQRRSPPRAAVVVAHVARMDRRARAPTQGRGGRRARSRGGRLVSASHDPCKRARSC